jgi:hypothetical protein
MPFKETHKVALSLSDKRPSPSQASKSFYARLSAFVRVEDWELKARLNRLALKSKVYVPGLPLPNLSRSNSIFLLHQISFSLIEGIDEVSVCIAF